MALEDRTLLTGTMLPIQQFDINQIDQSNGSSNPQQFLQIGNISYFLANDDQNGAELWKTDGSSSGTVLVKDIKPGTSGSNIRFMTNVNGTLYFRASEEAANYELWKSDGTTEGTIKVKEIRSTLISSFLYDLTEYNGKLLFSGNNGGEGNELWISDGTENGTTTIKNILPGFSGSDPRNFAIVNGIAYFTANQNSISPTFDRELWRTDGTANGTYAVADINPGSVGSLPQSLTNVNGTLYFTANDGTNGIELWKTDGTSSGTVLVKDINPSGSSSPSSLINLNGTLFFTADDGVNGVELWKTDGTAAGTVLVKDINTSGPSSLTSLVNLNGVLFFTANDGIHGTELWMSDGSAAGTMLVKDVQMGGTGSNPGSLTVMNNKLYFRANDGTTGDELWVSDGTGAGTVQVLDIASGVTGSAPGSLHSFNGTLLFQANDGIHGNELWKSDGTAVGTMLVKDLRVPQSPSNPTSLTDFNGTLFFQANDGVNGAELWKTDGTLAGTTLVSDIRLGATGSAPSLLTVVNGVLYFTADDGVNGLELWKTDGTNSGTSLVKDIRPGITGSNLSNLVDVGGTLYFAANDGVNGLELWKSDGTSSGTILVKNIRTAVSSSNPHYLTNVNGTLFFSASDGSGGNELWKSDGTESGTQMVADLLPAFFQGSNPTALTNVNGTLFFKANTDFSTEALFKSDGTVAGTVNLASFGNGIGPRFITAVENTVFFRAGEFTHGYELWKSDGTVAGTSIVRDIAPGNLNSYVTNLRNVNGTLYFLASENPQTAGQELWKSDGTNDGTEKVLEIIPRDVAPIVTKIQLLASRNDRLFFSAPGGDDRGLELWTSNGTGSGTFRVSDINPGPASSTFATVTSVILGGKMFFSADGGQGNELWAADINFPASSVSFANTTTSLAEDISTAARVKIADINVTDDSLGTNNLSLTGDDASSFEIFNGALYLKSGVSLDFETKSSYSVTLNVDDPTVGDTVDASAIFTLMITDANDVTLLGGTVANQPLNDNATISPFTAFTVVDPDLQSLSASVSIHNGTNRGDFTAASTVGWTRMVTGSEIRYFRTFPAAASIDASVQAAIRALVFQPRHDAILPNATETTAFIVSVSDGIAPPVSNSATSVVTTSVNDLLTIGGGTSNQLVSETSQIAPFTSLTVTDTDTQDFFVRATILNGVFRGDFTPASTTGWTKLEVGNDLLYERYYSPAANIGSVVQADLQTLIFQPRSNAINPGTTETTVFHVYVTDGFTNATNSTTSTITTTIDTPPTIDGASSSVTVNDNSTVNPFASLVVTDPDTQEMLISVTILNGVFRGDFTNANSGTGWAVREVVGNNITYRQYFSPRTNVGADAEAAFRALIFHPRTMSTPVGTTEVTDFQVTVSDGVAPAVVNTGTRVTTTSVNERPTDIALTDNSINENSPNAIVGVLSTTDPDSGDTFTYSIQPGGNGNEFVISGNSLKVGATGLDFEAGAIRSLTIRTTDQLGEFFDKVFSINLLDLQEAPILAQSPFPRIPDRWRKSETNDGETVANLIVGLLPTELITDPDSGSLEGFAVIDATHSEGTWEYSIDGGANWNSLKDASVANARLLDVAALIRFVPFKKKFKGEVALQIVAWDQTTGTNGGTADATTRGGSTAFSTDSTEVHHTVLKMQPSL